MPFYRPTLEQIRRRVQSDFRYEFGSDAVLVPGTVEHSFCEALVALSHAAHGRLDQIYRDAFPHLASAPALVKWAAFFGMYRNRATYAEDEMHFHGQPGKTIPTGTIVARADGFEYRVVAGGTFVFNLLKLVVRARTPGAAGNSPVAEMLLQSSIEGVNPYVETSDKGVNGGADAETPEELRVRLLALLNEPEGGGKKGDYVRWAKQVTGVTRAWEYGNTPKVGNVTVLFMRDNDEGSPFPNEAERDAVVAELKKYAPVALPDPKVETPIDHPLDLEIELTTEPGAILADVRAAIIKSLEDMIKTRASPAAQDGVLFYRSWISEAISTTNGELDHKLNVPTDDITLSQWHLVSLGDITWFNP